MQTIKASEPRRRFWVSAIAATRALLGPVNGLEISDDIVGAASTYAWYQFERSYFGFQSR